MSTVYRKFNNLNYITMARQGGILKIKGTIGGITFYKSSLDGHLLREKGGVSGDRIANDPAFARTRENGQEFGNSCNCSKYLRDALRTLMMNAADTRVSARLTQRNMQILKMDTVSVRGARTVNSGLATAEGKDLLVGFNFNINAILESILFKDYSLDLGTGEVSIVGLVPFTDMVIPSGATHYSMKTAYAKVDFETGKSVISISPSTISLVDNVPIDVTLTPDGGEPVGTGLSVYVLLIEFHQAVNSQFYTLKNGSYNALKIIAVA